MSFTRHHSSFIIEILTDSHVTPDEGKPKNGSSSSLYNYVTPEVMSTVVGAALGEQDCLRYSACIAGNYVADVTGKELVLM